MLARILWLSVALLKKFDLFIPIILATIRMNDTTFIQLQPGVISVFRVHYLDGIKKVLAENFDRGSVDAEGNNVLHLVCMPKNFQKHSVTAIRLVITNGFSVNARNNFGFTPLMLAALLLPSDLVKVVLEALTISESTDESLHDALLLAATYGKPDVVSALIGAGAKITNSTSIDVNSQRMQHLDRHKELLQKVDTLLGLFPEFDREIAQRNDLDDADLVRLASSTDGVTKQHVALNPNTPSNVLLKLAPEFPRAFYKNPAFDWLLLENPDLLFEMKQGVLKHILSLRDCPKSFLQWAAKNGSDSEKLVVVRRLDVENELLEIIVAGNSCRAATIAIARNLGSTLKQLESILGQDDSADRLLAAHPNANSKLLAKLSESRDEIVRKNVLNHKNTSFLTLRQMSDGHIRIHRLK